MNAPDYLLFLLRSALTGEETEEKEKPTEELLREVYELADRFDLAHMAAYELENRGLLTEGTLAECFRQRQILALYRTEKQIYEKKRIGAALEDAGVPHIFLKGAVLRDLYPEPWMRTAADIDLLVPPEYAERAKATLCKQLGCTVTGGTVHDDTLFLPGGVCAELHFTLTEDTPSWEDLFADLWNTAGHTEGKHYERTLSPELFYLYFTVHTVKHFENGGCGIRPLMDLYLLRRHTPERKKETDALLERAGLLRFADTMERVALHWFSDGLADELLRRTEAYILAGGLYGGFENRVAVRQTIQGGRSRYLFYRVFMPYEKLIALYPRLRGRRWLLPYYEVRRWGHHLFGGTVPKAIREWKESCTVAAEDEGQTENFLEELGLL